VVCGVICGAKLEKMHGWCSHFSPLFLGHLTMQAKQRFQTKTHATPACCSSTPPPGQVWDSLVVCGVICGTKLGKNASFDPLFLGHLTMQAKQTLIWFHQKLMMWMGCWNGAGDKHRVIGDLIVEHLKQVANYKTNPRVNKQKTSQIQNLD